MAVDCPICNKPVKPTEINSHIDSGCTLFTLDKEPRLSSPPASQARAGGPTQSSSSSSSSSQQQPKRSASAFFSTPARKKMHGDGKGPATAAASRSFPPVTGKKRSFEEGPGGEKDDGSSGANPRAAREDGEDVEDNKGAGADGVQSGGLAVKRAKKQASVPLAERMRPRTLDQVCGQDLVGENGVLRSLIESDRVPSMILWGASGTGKTTIARCVAGMVSGRFIELSATSAGVAECRRLFQEAADELGRSGRRTVVFCDEIHRFSKAQQDVFLKPVEAGTITLIGATTENPSFKVASALLSRCRTFTLKPLSTGDVVGILARARAAEAPAHPPAPLLDDEMLAYLAAFSDGDARTALNLLELALPLASRAGATRESVKAALTKTLVYDRGGDQHYDSISAFHKSVRGGDADAALYYLARMLQSGEDPLFVARRMVVIASEDVGLADNSLLPLATAAFTAAQQIGMPEARVPLAHCAIALCRAPKSVRAYRSLNNAYAALREPGVAALPIPLHLRNAPTRLMRDMGCGADYKYPPNYRDGRVSQTYLPPELAGRRFLEDRDLGTEIDPDVQMDEG
ncbi:uncharacterized protein UV8b_07236 [Ustilaginoidea virens]|uniref:DNA replication ATPase n=1 Tax=Ustilaginoidea virens TaxID=1159556 RepID=A0A8E5HX33_USTVR|nr:uncharacterized protein UV8b_07236 [Ustilaginoidea virens]QUC22995.1 hypothetical protein UV8b_07236 [Ustilaginoidea virens]